MLAHAPDDCVAAQALAILLTSAEFIMTGPLPMAKASANDASASLRGMRILVVEDDDDSRELLAMLLRNAGASVMLACNARQGFEMLGQEPDLVVSDIGMPGEDGISMLRRIRDLPASKGGEVPVVALTAFSAERDKKRAAEAGFTAYMTKPLNARALITVVMALRP